MVPPPPPYQAAGQYPPYGATPAGQPLPPMAQPANLWGQQNTGPIMPPYAVQPGAYPPGYAAPPAPASSTPSEPSPWMQPTYWVPKLPVIAIIVLAVCVVGGIVSLIFNLSNTAGYVDGPARAYAGLSSLIGDIVYGIAACALIMGFAHLIDVVTKKHKDDADA